MKHKWRKDHNGEIDVWAWESDFHSGPVCEVCGRTVCDSCTPYWMNLDDCPGPHIITNADHIRTMSDEELAKVISPHVAVRFACNCRKDWSEEILEWLKTPYGE